MRASLRTVAARREEAAKTAPDAKAAPHRVGDEVEAWTTAGDNWVRCHVRSADAAGYEVGDSVGSWRVTARQLRAVTTTSPRATSERTSPRAKERPPAAVPPSPRRPRAAAVETATVRPRSTPVRLPPDKNRDKMAAAARSRSNTPQRRKQGTTTASSSGADTTTAHVDTPEEKKLRLEAKRDERLARVEAARAKIESSASRVAETTRAREEAKKAKVAQATALREAKVAAAAEKRLRASEERVDRQMRGAGSVYS